MERLGTIKLYILSINIIGTLSTITKLTYSLLTKVLGTFPRRVTFLLYFSEAIFILCLETIVELNTRIL